MCVGAPGLHLTHTGKHPRPFLKHTFNPEAAACGLTLITQVSVTWVESGGKGVASKPEGTSDASHSSTGLPCGQCKYDQLDSNW